MRTVIRRQFLQGLNAALATCVMPTSTLGAAASIVARTRPRRTFTEGCIFVRDSGRKAQDDASPCTFDLWTARVSEIDLKSLPTDLGKIVVYDDLFSNNNTTRRFLDTARSIPGLFDLNPADCTFGFHLNGLSHMSEILSGFTICPTTNNNSSTRIAIIDIGSCGVTRLDWYNILPIIRSQYDFVVGFHVSLGRTMGDWDRFFEGAPRQNPDLIETLKYCDLSFLTSDGLLGLDSIASMEDRTLTLMDLLREILQSLSSPSILKKIQRVADASMFCVGHIRATDEGQKASEVARQQDVIADGFSDGLIRQRYINEPALILDTLALWPLRT